MSLEFKGDKNDWTAYPGLPYPHPVFNAQFNNLKEKNHSKLLVSL